MRLYSKCMCGKRISVLSEPQPTGREVHRYPLGYHFCGRNSLTNLNIGVRSWYSGSLGQQPGEIAARPADCSSCNVVLAIWETGCHCLNWQRRELIFCDRYWDIGRLLFYLKLTMGL